jgi:hypothetical protein
LIFAVITPQSSVYAFALPRVKARRLSEAVFLSKKDPNATTEAIGSIFSVVIWLRIYKVNEAKRINSLI